MAHLRTRYLTKIIQTALAGSPIVGLLGQRQTGKTTLAEILSNQYVSLDDEEQLELSLEAPKEFIENRKSPFAIDECQMSSALFPALKEHVRKTRKPGQFILTGSVRFTSVEEIRESLTGRIIDLELLPLSLTEAHELPLTDVHKLASAANPIPILTRQPFSSSAKRPALEEFLWKGGLPGICFVRSEAMRVRKIRSHLKTILDRDLRQVIRTETDYLTLKNFLEEIAIQQAEPFDLAKAARGARVAINTARKLVSGLESVFLVRTIRKEGDSAGKFLFFEDQALGTFLLRERGQMASKGAITLREWVRLLFQQLMAQVNYRSDLHSSIFSFRTRGGAAMDLCVRIDRHILGYSVGIGKQAASSQIQSAKSFQKRFPGARVFLLHQGIETRSLGDNVFETPLGSVL